jgi:hypothetical protein
MLSLREYRNKANRLADFLPWAALVAPGVVLNKDGSFQRSTRFRGPDLDSATPAELIATTARLNSALRRTIPTASSPIRPQRWSNRNARRSLPRRVRISRAGIS